MTIHLICCRCGSDNVRADAYAAWDSEEGDWVLHSVYDARICESCAGPTTLLEIDEETELEIGFYGMIKDGDGARLVEDHETPAFFDIVVRTTALTSGDILTLFEFDDQTRKDANASLAGLTVLFPKAPIDWHLGREFELIPSGGSNYCRVTRTQWEAHKANAPDVLGRDWVFCRFYEGAVNTGYVEDRYALCLITGAKRPITIAEHYTVFGATD